MRSFEQRLHQKAGYSLSLSERADFETVIRNLAFSILKVNNNF